MDMHLDMPSWTGEEVIFSEKFAEYNSLNVQFSFRPQIVDDSVIFNLSNEGRLTVKLYSCKGGCNIR